MGQVVSIQTQRANRKAIQAEYAKNPSTCTHCATPLVYTKRQNKFCGHSCSATFNNTGSTKRSKSVNDDLTVANLKESICLACDSVVPNGRKFCNNQCQANLQYKQKLALAEQGQASHKWAKRLLIYKHGNVCLDPECAWDFSKRPIAVELEHIDGNAENNQIENCTLLCPNCHSLTPTYKNKNKGNGRHARRQRYADGKSY